MTAIGTWVLSEGMLTPKSSRLLQRTLTRIWPDLSKAPSHWNE